MRRTGAIIAALALVALLTAAAPAGSMSLNVVYGTDGNDTIVATPAADVIYAKSGNDLITDVGSNDVVWASSGNDTIRFGSGWIENAAVHANVGHDKIEGILSTAAVVNSLVNAGSGNDSVKVVGCFELQGESGNDTYENPSVCSLFANTANLGNGHDKFKLGSLAELLLGNGNDQGSIDYPNYVHAGSGNDRLQILSVQAGSVIHLGTGHDEVLAQSSIVGGEVFGSNGNDRISYVWAGGVNVHGQSGNDTFTIENAVGSNVLSGDQNRDKARLGSGVTGTTCNSIETIVDLAHHASSCS
jgi:Ca2+-binding RTX toxin-like protein